MQPMQAPAAPAPALAPSLTVVNNPAPQASEPNFAQLYDETPAETTTPPGSPWTSMATTAPTPAAPAPQTTMMETPDAAPTTQTTEAKQSNFLFSEEDAPRTQSPATAAKKKGPSLFERVTGIATGRNKASDMDDDMDETSESQARTGSFMGLNLGNAPAAPTTESQRREPQLVNQQPAKLSQADEDLLEIPAFLRRQAN